MSDEFGPAYSDAYDGLYSDKDYAGECDLVEKLFCSYGGGRIRTLLDLGCGTGNHAVRLCQRGYEVVGIDRSAHMLGRARQKGSRAALKGCLHLINADTRSVGLKRTFDAALMMFAVLGYQTADEDVASALGSVRRHLREGGLFLFDVWYAPAVLRLGLSRRTKKVDTDDGSVTRSVYAETDPDRRVCKVHYRLDRTAGGCQLPATFEQHTMRYFEAGELAKFLLRSGMVLVRLGAFPEFDRDPDETTWNVLALARAK